jgi:RimJ/RimL family protein N-acetyltransferase
MRVTFPRLPDHARGYALIERDDGAVYQLYGGTAGSRLPHDILHLVVERELRIGDGIWGGIAAGVVFDTMRYVRGRRVLHTAERSGQLLRGFSRPRQRAELLAELVSSAASLDHLTAAGIRQLAADRLPGDSVDTVAIAVAARALQVEAARWARLRVGENLCYDWPVPTTSRPGGPGDPGDPVARAIVPAPRAADTRLCSWVRDREHGRMNARPAEVISRGEVTLRRHRPDDLDAVLLAVTESRDHLRPWMPWAQGYSRASAQEFLAKAARDWDEGTAYNYAIISGGAIAGGCSLMARIGPGGLEIGYWMHQAYTRRGLATAAAAALTEQAFVLPGVQRVEIVHDELNIASGKIPAKLGFTEVTRRPIDPPSPEGTGTGVVWRLFR